MKRPEKGGGTGAALGTQVLRYSGIHGFGMVLANALTFVSTIVIANFASPAEFGRLGLLLFYAGLLTLLFTLASKQGTLKRTFGGDDDEDDEDDDDDRYEDLAVGDDDDDDDSEEDFAFPDRDDNDPSDRDDALASDDVPAVEDFLGIDADAAEEPQALQAFDDEDDEPAEEIVELKRSESS